MAPNGYQYVKTPEGWELTSRVIAERNLGRTLRAHEYVTFKDGNRTNLDPSNIIVQFRGRTSLKRKLAQVEAQIESLEATKMELERRLRIQENL